MNVKEVTADGIWRAADDAAADHPILTREQERRLAMRIERGDMQARDELIRCNYRLVAKLAGEMCREYLPYHDAISVGHIGLMRAVEKFDYRRGFKFSTYATWWVRQAIDRERDLVSTTIRLPVHVRVELRSLTTAQRECAAEGVEATDAELAERMGESAERIAELRELLGRSMRSLDEPISDDAGAKPRGHLLPSEADTAEEAGALLEAGIIRAALDSLSDRERSVIGALYHEGDALGKVAQDTGLSEVEVRRVERDARRQLRELLEGEGE